MTQRRWLPVPGWDQYLVADDGCVLDVRSCKLLDYGSKGHQVWLQDGNTYLRTSPGTLVLMAFVGPKPEGKECCHKDDNRDNNALENVYWGTRADNVADYIRNGRRAHIYGEDAQHVQLTEAEVLEAALLRLTDRRLWTYKALGERYNITGSAIWNALNGRTWKHLHMEGGGM